MSASGHHISQTKKIIFFDGVCVLCNSLADFVLKWDKKNKFLFAPLQGETAKKYGLSSEEEKMRSLIFADGEKIYMRSAASVRILMGLGGLWKLTGILLLIPSFIRDFFYDIIAKRRYTWFGKRETCRVPQEREKEKFLN